MSTPDVTEAVALALAVSAESEPRIVAYETARIAIDAVRKADAEAGAVTLMPGEQPPWNYWITVRGGPGGGVSIKKGQMHEPATLTADSFYAEVLGTDLPPVFVDGNTHEGEET